MESVLAKLYFDNQPDTASPELRALTAKANPYYDKLIETFTLDYANEFWQTVAAIGFQEAQERFIDGLRLGVFLALELFPQGLPAPPKNPLP